MIIFKIILILLFCGCVHKDKNLQVLGKKEIMYRGNWVRVEDTNTIKSTNLNTGHEIITRKFFKEFNLNELGIATLNRDFKLGAFYCDLGIDGQYDWKLKVCYLGHVVFFQTFIWFEGDWLEVSCIVHSPLIWFGGGIELRNDDLKKEVLDIPSSLSSLEELRRDDLKKEAPDSDEGLVELALRKYSYLYIFFSGTQIAYDFKKLKWVEYVAEDHYSLERRYNDVQKNVK